MNDVKASSGADAGWSQHAKDLGIKEDKDLDDIPKLLVNENSPVDIKESQEPDKTATKEQSYTDLSRDGEKIQKRNTIDNSNRADLQRV